MVIDTSSLGLSSEEVADVTVGGVRALDLQPTDGGALSALLQGAPQSGPASVRLQDAAGEWHRLEQEFIYAPPIAPEFERVVALGASLTMGVTGGTPTFEGVQFSPSLLAARGMGAYFPQPLLKPGLFPTLGLDSVGPAPDCRTENVQDFLISAIGEILGDLAYPDGSGFGYELGRMDPELEVHNFAVGGYRLDDYVGTESDDFVPNVLGGFVFDPLAEFGSVLDVSMLEAVEAAEPTLIMSFDLMGNDLLLGRSVSRVEEYLPEILERLAATGAEVFIANAPNPDILEGSIGGEIPDEGGDELAEAYNAVLASEAALYGNVHVVDLKASSDELAELGIEIDGEAHNTQILGGILSFDGLHFSPTGYGLTAQYFLNTIDQVLGTETLPVDLPSIAATDIHTPKAIREAGREPSECWD